MNENENLYVYLDGNHNLLGYEMHPDDETAKREGQKKADKSLRYIGVFRTILTQEDGYCGLLEPQKEKEEKEYSLSPIFAETI